jgi:TetR/AcrR family transcriptional repressor of mexJK operon
MLGRFFVRPDIRAQLRADVPLDLLPEYLMSCISGDQLCRFVLAKQSRKPEEIERELEGRLDLFYHAVLAKP